MISLFFDKFRKACFSSLVRLEGTFFYEFRTLIILFLVILVTDIGRSRRPFSAFDIIFCLGIVFCETPKFEPNAKTLVFVFVSRCFEILIAHLPLGKLDGLTKQDWSSIKGFEARKSGKN